MKKKKVSIIHTSFVSVEALKELFLELLPEAELTNIVDDSLLPEVIANNGITEGVVGRITAYAQQAEKNGADIILNPCSSVGEAADRAAEKINIPFIKVDASMAEKAVEIGSTIAVMATVASTMGPSCRLIEKAAAERGKKVTVVPCLVDGALDILVKEKNREKHNKLVREKIEAIQNDVDVIVLAQGSMIVLLPELQHIQKPVLSSPRLGVEKIKELLTERTN